MPLVPLSLLLLYICHAACAAAGCRCCMCQRLRLHCCCCCCCRWRAVWQPSHEQHCMLFHQAEPPQDAPAVAGPHCNSLAHIHHLCCCWVPYFRERVTAACMTTTGPAIFILFILFCIAASITGTAGLMVSSPAPCTAEGSGCCCCCTTSIAACAWRSWTALLAAAAAAAGAWSGWGCTVSRSQLLQLCTTAAVTAAAAGCPSS